MITRDTINQLTSSQILSFYVNFNSLYSTKPFYLGLITYLLNLCAKYDRLDLVNVIFARFIYDISASSRKHVLGVLVIRVWNVMARIYADKGQPEEVISSKSQVIYFRIASFFLFVIHVILLFL